MGYSRSGGNLSTVLWIRQVAPPNRKQHINMNSSPSIIIKHIGLDVHAQSILPAIASPDGEVRAYSKIGGKLADVDRLIKRLEAPRLELRFVYDPSSSAAIVLGRRGQRPGPRDARIATAMRWPG